MLVIEKSEDGDQAGNLASSTTSTSNAFSAASSSAKGPLPLIPPVQDAPPPYHPDDSNLSPSSGSETIPSVNHARSNYLEILESHRAIKGIWVIDSNLKIPSSVLENQQWDEKDGVRPNLNVYTRHGSVKGDVVLCGPSEDIVNLKVGSCHGSVKLKVDNRTKQKLRMNVSTRSANVIIYIPSDFSGHVEATTVHGKVTYSDRISENLTQFSANHGKHHTFLSPSPIPSGSEGATAFDDALDNLIVTTRHGSIKIYYFDEAKDEVQEDKSGSKKGFLGRLFSSD